MAEDKNLCGMVYGIDDDDEYTTYCDLTEGHDGPHSHAGQILWNDEDDISLDDALTELAPVVPEEEK